ncbi:unnamed protein product, partial [Staurois parvus]
MTERGQRMLKHTVRRIRQVFVESIAKNLQTSRGLQISRAVRRELHGMGFPWPSSRIQALHHQVQCKVGCSGKTQWRRMVLVRLHFTKCKV